jgi:type VI secretion system secreted protein Hcp
MSRSRVRYVVSVALAVGLVALAAPASAALTMDVFATNTAGPSMRFELLNAEWGVTMPVNAGPSGAARTSGRAAFSDVTVSRRADFNSGPLAIKCASGERIYAVKLHFTDGGSSDAKPVEWQTITLSDVVLTSVGQVVGSGGRGDSTEKLTISFRKVVIEESPSLQVLPPAPAVPGRSIQGWDLDTNTRAALPSPVTDTRVVTDERRAPAPAPEAATATLVLPATATRAKVAAR